MRRASSSQLSLFEGRPSAAPELPPPARLEPLPPEERVRSRWPGPYWAPPGGPLSAVEVERLHAGLSLEPAGLLYPGGEAWCARCIAKCFAQLGLRLWRAARADGSPVRGVAFRCAECGVGFDGMWLRRHDPSGAGENPARRFYGLDLLPEEETDDMGLDQYFTNPGLAERIVEWSGLIPELAPHDHYRILEPSAGDGSFVRAILAASKARVVAIEIDPAMCVKLRELGEGERLKVLNRDFLTCPLPGLGETKPFDLAITNPPYGKRGDGTPALAAKHLAHAARLAKRVVALVPASIAHGDRNHNALWSFAVVTRRVELVDRPAFGGPDDVGDSARRDHVVIELEECDGNVPDVFSVHTERWRLP